MATENQMLLRLFQMRTQPKALSNLAVALAQKVALAQELSKTLQMRLKKPLKELRLLSIPVLLFRLDAQLSAAKTVESVTMQSDGLSSTCANEENEDSRS